MHAPEKSYHRTVNDDGTHNSRCLDCLMTIAHGVTTEEELARREGSHLCPEKILAQMRTAEKAHASRETQSRG
jgi:hypothetical protein